MSHAGDAPPAGYVRLWHDGISAVVRETDASSLREALADGSLYAHAAGHPARKELMGRAPAYAIPLPVTGTQVVVRHSSHGGKLAWLTRDRFLPPTRAPNELRAALRLRDAGVPTPTVVAYVVYPARFGFYRADVATELVREGRDGAEILAETTDRAARDALFGAIAGLLRLLGAAGARHPDLNLKNVLISAGASAGSEPCAWVLDVDRVTFAPPGHSASIRSNVQRLSRSLRKWRDRYGLTVSEDEIASLERRVNARAV